MPADLNDYFKKRGNGGDSQNNNSGGGNNFKMPQFNGFDNKKALPIYILIAVILLLIVARPFRVINSGELGIRETTGIYSPNTLEPGLHFFVPFIQNIIVVDAKVRMMSYVSSRPSVALQKIGTENVETSSVISHDSISVKDARNLDFKIDLNVLYRLDRTNAPSTIATWGFNWETKIIDPAVKQVVLEVAGKYNAEDIQQQREAFAREVKEGITKSIDVQKGNLIVLEDVQLREIMLPEDIRKQIERVQIARQETERTRYEVEKARQDAEKEVALAKGEADAMKTRAQGKADAIKIEADANSYANLQISKSLTGQLLQLRQIETQAKFNDALKENRDAQIFLTPGGAVPNIWVDTKDKQKQSSIGQ
ncbi:MAG: prohibitin family protein [Campylobacteraceae bacterium]|jgi:regulator of protease activity HflC (stomatin/prohibitin superfamily)|nr:prohibitin family protein [Campylobacteraceae bacterium]